MRLYLRKQIHCKIFIFLSHRSALFSSSFTSLYRCAIGSLMSCITVWLRQTHEWWCNKIEHRKLYGDDDVLRFNHFAILLHSEEIMRNDRSEAVIVWPGTLTTQQAHCCCCFDVEFLRKTNQINFRQKTFALAIFSSNLHFDPGPMSA